MSKSTLSRPWSDEQLANAVKVSANWREVLRILGLNPTSSGTLRVVRQRAAELGLGSSHFRGKRKWTDSQLAAVITGANTWDQVITQLGLSANSGKARTLIKGHAMRLDLDCSHLAPRKLRFPETSGLRPQLNRLRDAAVFIASAWFTLCGCPVSLPLEPATFDLLVSMPDEIIRVQVKSTTYRGEKGWQVSVGRQGNLPERTAYDPEVIDLFCIVDGDLNIYVIPSRILGGRVAVLLRAYTAYIVGNATGMMPTGTPQAPPPTAA